ncbi:hypothetical protein SteCoe_4887 [Stentor coeruleus]|uniref:Myb-like DNA-binding domain containing protein n=1 Tax=Stentor coeruleus TaxID=5963 RepID=A0A1R2CTL5_9CILI|nr:hypothetical protein SteCoe_4887 [Stentor coeruleus]
MVKDKKRYWNKNEDRILSSLIRCLGAKNWKKISMLLAKNNLSTIRTPKQCRDRWVNQLDPKLCSRSWSNEDEALLVDKYKALGNKWSRISRFFPGRSPNNVKNHFYSLIRKNLRRHNRNLPIEKRITEDVPTVLRNQKYSDLVVQPTIPKGFPKFNCFSKASKKKFIKPLNKKEINEGSSTQDPELFSFFSTLPNVEYEKNFLMDFWIVPLFLPS